MPHVAPTWASSSLANRARSPFYLGLGEKGGLVRRVRQVR